MQRVVVYYIAGGGAGALLIHGILKCLWTRRAWETCITFSHGDICFSWSGHAYDWTIRLLHHLLDNGTGGRTSYSILIPRRGVPWLVMIGDYAGAYSEYRSMPACAAVP